MADIRKYIDFEDQIAPGRGSDWWQHPARQRRINRLLRLLETGKLNADGTDSDGNPVSLVLIRPTRTVTSDSTILATDGIVFADASDAPITLTLPQASLSDGLVLGVKKVDTTSHSVRVVTAFGETIDLGEEADITVPMTLLEFISTNSNWWLG